MKFGIERASGFFPCAEARENEYIDVYGERSIFYTIEINTLEELINLYEKYGRLIIGQVYDFQTEYINAGCKQTIVIYDDWVE